MTRTPVLVVAAVVALQFGCSDPKAREIERQRAELEATKAELTRARAEAADARADLVQALTDAQVARTELARLRGEPAPAPRPRTAEPDAVPLDQRFAGLRAQ